MRLDKIYNKYPLDPIALGEFDVPLKEMMHYLYLPVKMAGSSDLRLPHNIAIVESLIRRAEEYCDKELHRDPDKDYYYISARKGFATRDNPLNRPGLHCDGYGTDDANFVYWIGHGTRFTKQEFDNISGSHTISLVQYAQQVEWNELYTPPEKTLYYLSPACVHTTPAIPAKGAMRQYIKVSVSTHQYNLEDNSHNYLFDYDWKMCPRALMRNDPHKAQRDYT